MPTTRTRILAALAATPLVIGLSACASGAGAGTDGDGGGDVVRIGIVGKSDPQWPAFEEAAA